MSTNTEEIGIRLVPYFYYFEHIGKPVKNYSFIILFCSLAGPFSLVNVQENKSLLHLLTMTNYGTRSPQLGDQIGSWARKYVAKSEWNSFKELVDCTFYKIDEIADATDILMQKTIDQNYFIGEIIPEIVPFGKYNKWGRNWPII